MTDTGFTFEDIFGPRPGEEQIFADVKEYVELEVRWNEQGYLTQAEWKRWAELRDEREDYDCHFLEYPCNCDNCRMCICTERDEGKIPTLITAKGCPAHDHP